MIPDAPPDWARLEALEAVIRSELPPATPISVTARDSDGDCVAGSIAEVRAETTERGATLLDLYITARTSELSVSVGAGHLGGVFTPMFAWFHVDGSNEAAVLGLGALYRRQIRRQLPSPEDVQGVNGSGAEPSTPAQGSRVGATVDNSPAPAASPPKLDPPAPTDVVEEKSLAARAANNPWVVTIVGGLIVIVLIAGAVLLTR
jgi:hypothetical protein